MDPNIIAMGVGFAVQLLFMGYSYGGLNQKVKDVDARLERVENKLNGRLSPYDSKEGRK